MNEFDRLMVGIRAEADASGKDGYSHLAQYVATTLGPVFSKPRRGAFHAPIYEGLAVVFGVDDEDNAGRSERGIAELRRRLADEGFPEVGFGRDEGGRTVWAFVVRTTDVESLARIAWEAWNVANGFQAWYTPLRDAQEAACRDEDSALRN